jgi:ketosteroid isomerase-like protein
MYQRLVRGRIVSVFDHLSDGDYEYALRGLTPKVHHRFAGHHPLGGERTDREAVRSWFERLYRLFPRLQFTVHRTGASGWPWDLRVFVEWTAEVTPAVGPSYQNVGAHVLRIRRGKVSEFLAYEDSQAVAEACALMAQAGIDEAAAPPITSGNARAD